MEITTYVLLCLYFSYHYVLILHSIMENHIQNIFSINNCVFFVSDIRQELNEQLKCLDMRLETEMAMIAELQDFFKRRAEVEMEYSKGLDRIVKQIMLRHKSEKQRYVTAGFYSQNSHVIFLYIFGDFLKCVLWN